MDDLLVKGKFPRPVDPAAVERDWRRRGYSCHPFRDPPGRIWRDFVHTTNELVTVQRGRLEVTIGGRSLIAEEGDEVFIPRHATHTVRNISERETTWHFGYD